MIWWCMKCYDFLFETIWYACMDAWMYAWNLIYFSFFHFFINLRNVGGVMHMHTLWIIDDVWHAMIFFLNLDDESCMDAWMHGCMGEFCFIKKKMNYSCMHDLVWCMNFSFAFFWKQYSNWFPFHCYF